MGATGGLVAEGVIMGGLIIPLIPRLIAGGIAPGGIIPVLLFVFIAISFSSFFCMANLFLVSMRIL